MQRVIDIADLGAFRPAIQRLPLVEPHAMYLDQVWMGGATYTIDEINEHIQNCQLAVAQQLSRSIKPVANESGL